MNMRLPFAIFTAGHGLDWTYPNVDISLGELEDCRAAFGRLPDFDSGEVGFEGIAVRGNRVFVVRCFRAAKWDFLGRDSVYLAATWLPLAMFGGVDVEALFALPKFREPMRNPPSRFELEVADGMDGTVVVISGVELRDGVVLRRELGESAFVKVDESTSESTAEIESSILPPPHFETGKVMVKRRNWKVAAGWALTGTLLGAALVLFAYDVLHRFGGYGNDGSGADVERRDAEGTAARTNGVAGGTVSAESTSR